MLNVTIAQFMTSENAAKFTFEIDDVKGQQHKGMEIFSDFKITLCLYVVFIYMYNLWICIPKIMTICLGNIMKQKSINTVSVVNQLSKV